MANVSQARRWCFTINNPTINDKLKLGRIAAGDEMGFGIIHMVAAMEIAPTTGTPHIQGYIEFNRMTRGVRLRNFLFKCHWEPAKGTREQNEEYCLKDVKENTQVYHLNGPVKKPGKRNDLKECYKMKADGASTSAIMEKHPGSYIRYKNSIDKIHAEVQQCSIVKELGDLMRLQDLKVWQQHLVDILKGPPNHRHVYWYTDVAGGLGKTWLSKYLVATMGAIRFDNGKSADVKYAYQGQRIAIFDLVRSCQDHINYEVIEQIKNGIYFTGKYESAVKISKPPHVVVFSNANPDQSKLSADRWVIHNLDPTMEQEAANGRHDVQMISPPVSEHDSIEYIDISSDSCESEIAGPSLVVRTSNVNVDDSIDSMDDDTYPPEYLHAIAIENDLADNDFDRLREIARRENAEMFESALEYTQRQADDADWSTEIVEDGWMHRLNTDNLPICSSPISDDNIPPSGWGFDSEDEQELINSANGWLDFGEDANSTFEWEQISRDSGAELWNTSEEWRQDVYEDNNITPPE